MAGPRIPGAGFFDIDGVATPHSTPPQLVFHTIHGNGIFTYTCHTKNQLHVGKYSIHGPCMGFELNRS